jgi:hypothetical protein
MYRSEMSAYCVTNNCKRVQLSSRLTFSQLTLFVYCFNIVPLLIPDVTCMSGYRRGYIVRFEVFTAVTMKNAVFWDVTPCRSCVNRRFGGTSVDLV